MSRAVWTGTIAGIVLVGGLFYYLHRDEGAPPEDSIEEEILAPIEERAPPPIRYPVPDTTPVQPEAPTASEDSGFTAPSIAPTPLPREPSDTNAEFRAGLGELFGEEPIEAFVVPQRVIQRMVVFVNSLDGGPVPPRVWPFKHVTGPHQVEGSNGSFTSSARNADRYAPYLAALRAVDSQRLVNLYFRYYPLFQQAYAEIGYPGRYFNDRLIDIIDHLLAAPDVEAPALVRPKVLYQYADPDLEQRSSGQKILMRMGPRNAAQVRDKLREVRALLVSGARPQESSAR